jgi:hypothetical protein
LRHVFAACNILQNFGAEIFGVSLKESTFACKYS